MCASGAEGELDALLWLMDVVQSEVDAPLSLDSPNAHVLEAAMRHAKRPALINSISLEGGKAQRLLPQIAAQGHSCVALLLHDGVPTDVEGRMQAFERILALADDCGLPRGRLFLSLIHISPRVRPISASTVERFSSTWRAWPSTSAASILPLAGLTGIMPERKTRLSTQNAVE